MALYINLYHEVQKQKLKRQRDPFKIGIMVILLIAVGFLAYYFWRLESVQLSKAALARVQSEWKTTEPKQKVALARRDELDQAEKLRDAVVHEIENRFYWAPAIEQILGLIPADVQITTLSGSVVNSGAKKVTIAITGISAGAQPRTVADQLRTTLKDKLSARYQQVETVFGSLEDSTGTVEYQGRTLPTANFVIDLTFTEPDIDDAEKPKTPLRVRKP